MYTDFFSNAICSQIETKTIHIIEKHFKNRLICILSIWKQEQNKLSFLKIPEILHGMIRYLTFKKIMFENLHYTFIKSYLFLLKKTIPTIQQLFKNK